MQLELGTLAEFIDGHAAVHASRSFHSDLIDDFTCLEVDHHHVVQRRCVLLPTADHQMVVESSKSGELQAWFMQLSPLFQFACVWIVTENHVGIV